MNIIHKITGKILFKSKKATMKETVIEAVKKKSDLSEANLWGADLSGAYLRGAHLRLANLWGAYLLGANLREADLWGAKIMEGEERSVLIAIGITIQKKEVKK